MESQLRSYILTACTPLACTFWLLVVWLLVACATTPPVPSQQPTAPPYSGYTPAPARSSVSGGKVVFADTGFPGAVNPLFASSSIDLELSPALWAAPIVYDQHFHAHADQLTELPLPENGGVQEGGKTIIMHLRHDLRWSDGQPITASDFQYWWQLDQDPNTGATITSGYDQIASIDVPDNFTVVLHMQHPFGPYLFYLPYAAPRHAWDKFQHIDLQNRPDVYLAPQVTDGPYMVSSYVAGQSYSMVPNPYYTSTVFHGPFLSQLTYRSYDSISDLTTAIQQQQTDLAQGYMEYELPQLTHLPAGVKLLKTSAAAYEHLDFNNANPLFQDVHVRRAIAMAINVCGILQDILHMPDCSRRIGQVEPPPSLYYDSTLSPIMYDPGAARTLLAQAGWQLDAQGVLVKQDRPFVVRLVTTADNPLRAAVAARIQENLRTVGIQVKLAYYPLNTFFAVYTRGGILATGAFDLAMFGYANSPEPDDEYTAYHSSQIPTAQNPTLGNYARVNDPLIDQALTQGRETVAATARIADYHQFLKRLASQVYIIPLYVGVDIMIIDTRLQNVIPNPNAVANDWNVADWWLRNG